ncbi:MAG: PAS domain-containing sensor histidine kinase [Desulfobacteraceae bacterium]|nr:PAS domain-containing sensor histidine kinase [Desulfobacteraceae bacterium]
MPKLEVPLPRRIGWITVYYALCFFLLLAFGPGAGPAFAQAQAQVDLTGKNVLVMHSGEANAPLFLKTDKGLATTLESGGISELNQFFESLNIILNPGIEYRQALVEKLRLQYGHRKVDVIITMYPEALAFVLADCADIFPHVPIIALYLQKSLELPNADRTIVQHTATLDITGTLEIALGLVPGAKRVYVVSGVHEIDQRIEAQARRDLKKWETRLEFHYLSNLPFEDILATASSVPPDSILLLLVLVRDVNGENFRIPIVAQRLSQVCAAPIFGIVDTGMGYGIVGGTLLDPEHVGAKAGELALDFLKGNQPPGDASKILKISPVPMFDWRQLKRWNLSQSALPQGSIIQNKEFTLWDFKYHIIGIMAFCLVESALIIFLLVQRRRKKSAEVSLRKTEEKYRNIFEGAIEGIFEISPLGQPLTINPALTKILGYASPAEFISNIRDWWSLLPAGQDNREEFVSLIEKQDVVFDFECELLRRDGAKIWASISARRVCGPDGKTPRYSGFVEEITERKRWEQATRENERILRQNENDLRTLTGRLIHNQEEERRRLARELHDDLVQRLAVFAIDVGELEKQLMDRPAPVQAQLREMKTNIIKISQDIHRLSRQLHPSILDDLGLNKAVEAECMNVSRREGIEIVFSHENIPAAIPKDISLAVYRIVQEGLSNISKHACAEHITVGIKGVDHDLLLTVEDDGIGFEPAQVRKKPGLGLSSMRERARMIAGDLSIASQPDKGTVITLRVPFTREGE